MASLPLLHPRNAIAFVTSGGVEEHNVTQPAHDLLIFALVCHQMTFRGGMPREQTGVTGLNLGGGEGPSARVAPLFVSPPIGIFLLKPLYSHGHGQCESVIVHQMSLPFRARTRP